MSAIIEVKNLSFGYTPQNMILKETITWDIFDKVLLSSRDMIFPFKNLEKAWEKKPQKTVIDLPHFCFTAWNSWDEMLKT